MGFTYVNVTVHGKKASRDIKMLVGTGSTYIVLDPGIIRELDVPTPVLSVYALETLGLKVNPRTGELEEISPEGGYLL